MRTGLCNCFALYDWDGDITPGVFHEIVKSLFDEFGVVPDITSTTPPNAEKNYVQEYVNFLADLPKLQGNIDFYHTVPGYKQLVFGWDCFASLSTRPDKTMVFCCDHNLANLGLECFETVARSLAGEIQLKYGIGYQRSFKLGPEMYAYGMVTGLKYSQSDLAEADHIGMWVRERLDANRHLRGYLRDVYPLNVISSCHLARHVEGLSLSQWIEASSDRGQLIYLGKDTFLWEVPDEQISEVRHKLRAAECTIVPP
jgi:hypothetical protein